MGLKLLLGMKCVCRHQDLEIYGLKLNKINMSIFPCEDVGRDTISGVRKSTLTVRRPSLDVRI